MKPGAIHSTGLKLGLRAFDSPQQPVGLPTPGPSSFPARHKTPVWFSQGPATAEGLGRQGALGGGEGHQRNVSLLVCHRVCTSHSLPLYNPKSPPLTCTHTHKHECAHKHAKSNLDAGKRTHPCWPAQPLLAFVKLPETIPARRMKF